MSEDVAGARAATPPADGRAPDREGSPEREETRPAVHSPRPDLRDPGVPRLPGAELLVL